MCLHSKAITAVKFLVIGFVVFFYSCKSKIENAQQPNILLISVDDMGWSDIGAYGSEVETPNLNMLAEQGIRFTNFSNTSKCFPSRASLITGVYARDCGYHESFRQPIRNAVTIGEVLQTAGYNTYWTGKHHGKDNPYNRGFNGYSGLKDGASNHFNPGVQREGEPDPARKRTRTWAIDSVLYEPYTPEDRDFYTTDTFTDYALDYLKDNSEGEKPFFMYIAYTAPHDPIMAWPEDIAKYDGMYDEGYEAIRKKRFERQLDLGIVKDSTVLSDPVYTPWSELTEAERQYEADVMEVYAAMIDRVDQNIGRLIGTLDSLNYLENTLILFVSDNGASSEVINLDTDDDTAPIGSMARWISLKGDWANVANTPYRFFKNYSYEGGVNTPMIAYWPGKIEEGAITSYPGHFIDFMATFVDMTGADYPQRFNGQEITPMRGKSLLPVFQDPKLSRREGPLFWEWSDGKAMREGPWKIVKEGEESPWELYNLVEDPTEMHNLADEKPEIVDSLGRKHELWATDQFFE